MYLASEEGRKHQVFLFFAPEIRFPEKVFFTDKISEQEKKGKFYQHGRMAFLKENHLLAHIIWSSL